jgi:hypothetical protein
VTVEFYSSSVSKELNGEEEMGQCRFSGGSERGMTTLQFGSSHAEDGGSRRRTTRQCGRRGDGAGGSRRWEMTPWWAVPGRKAEQSAPISMGVKERRNGPSDKMGQKPRRLQRKLFFKKFKQNFRFKNQRF